jgi:hypothetical protein
MASIEHLLNDAYTLPKQAGSAFEAALYFKLNPLYLKQKLQSFDQEFEPSNY